MRGPSQANCRTLVLLCPAPQEVCSTLPLPYVNLQDTSYCTSVKLPNPFPGYSGSQAACSLGHAYACASQHCRRSETLTQHHACMSCGCATAGGEGGLTSDARLGKCSLLHTQSCGLQSWEQARTCARFLNSYTSSRGSVLQASSWATVQVGPGRHVMSWQGAEVQMQFCCPLGYVTNVQPIILLWCTPSRSRWRVASMAVRWLRAGQLVIFRTPGVGFQQMHPCCTPLKTQALHTLRRTS